jgi:hypothetical protein
MFKLCIQTLKPGQYWCPEAPVSGDGGIDKVKVFSCSAMSGP